MCPDLNLQGIAGIDLTFPKWNFSTLRTSVIANFFANIRELRCISENFSGPLSSLYYQYGPQIFVPQGRKSRLARAVYSYDQTPPTCSYAACSTSSSHSQSN